MQNVAQLMAIGIKQLSHLNNPKLESEMILAFVLGVDRVWIKMHGSDLVDEGLERRFKALISKRYEFVPLAQIMGYRAWAEFDIEVDDSTLIPRDETEILCEKIFLQKRDFEVQRILDIGTGSGCISIYLKNKFLSASVLGVDVSEKALLVAQRNAKKYNLDILFEKSDLLESVKGDFDIIVANLPYVPEKYEVSPDLSFEPASAIFSGDSGLDLISELQVQLALEKVAFKELWLEFLPFQKESILLIWKDYKVTFETDLGGDVFFACITPDL